MKYINYAAPLFFISLLTGCGNGSSENTPGNTENAAGVQTTAPATTTTDNAASINPQPVATTTSTSTTSTAVAGLNPEHGKPGHRCDIAVGAPLDSKPAPATAVNAPPNFSSVKAPVINTSPTATTSPVTTTSTSATVANGLNPEHGKPGHRCEIAVGAPLDSKPVMTTGVESNAISTNTPATTPATVASGLNPEHGKPGHRCDIAVGAPLDSKPKQ